MKVSQLFRYHLLSNKETSQHHYIPFRFIIGTSITFLIFAILLWITNGYHAGFYTLNTLGSKLPNVVCSFITLLGDTQVAIALLLFIVYVHPKLLSATIIAIIPTTFITHGMKSFFAMARPGGVLPENSFHLVGNLLRTHSFPSGHSATAGVIASFFLVVAKNKQQRIGVIFVLMMVMLSRVMVGAHWPIDVFVGGAIGLLCGLICYMLAKRYHFCQSALSQWVAMTVPLYCALTLPFHNGGYPEGHYEVILVAIVALLYYLSQLQKHWFINKKLAR
ncbi:phosphatase PAP2 family protein [Marinomonas sp. TI.3.20]|uniref:phosphatase PAP2 family protein n=1 Tax=Marinomonas sp. TI.3.20 TaxID=3121296 RepID=UPI00311E1595